MTVELRRSPKAAGTFSGGGLTLASYHYLQEYVHRFSGVVVESDKQYLLESRLLPVVRSRNLAGLDALCETLRRGGDAELRQKVVEAMTTHETFFFRDKPQYEALRTIVVPELLEERRLAHRLRFWSAASSSGQEAYSLAMMVLDLELKGWAIEIVGTDLSEQILDRARRGRFLQVEVNRGLMPRQLMKYFVREGVEWQLADLVRRKVRFERMDLREILHGFGPFDVVMCRNVLIYFDVETKTRILHEIRKTLPPGGYLLLGASETTLNLSVQFEARQIGDAMLYRAC